MTKLVASSIAAHAKSGGGILMIMLMSKLRAVPEHRAVLKAWVRQESGIRVELHIARRPG